MRRIKTGIVGLGRAGRFMHIPELLQYPDCFEIVAVADLAPERRCDLPEGVKNARVYTSFDEVIADKEVELVTIATRSEFHTAQAIMAMEAGKYVVLDKPVAVSYEEVLKLQECCGRFPGKCFLRFNRRFEPLFNQIREIIAEGILGKINTVKLYRHTGFVRRYDWQTLYGCRGGLLNNWGPHLVDQALCFLGGKATDIWCDLKHVISAGDAEDQIKLLLRNSSGMVADIEVSNTVTLPVNWYEVWGDRGALTAPADGDEITLKYLKPDFKFTPLKAIEGLYPLSYGNAGDKLEFVTETRPRARSKGHTFQRGKLVNDGTAKYSGGYTYDDTMWKHVYAGITAGEVYPVSIAEGVEVVRVIDFARKQSGYTPHTLPVNDGKTE